MAHYCILLNYKFRNYDNSISTMSKFQTDFGIGSLIEKFSNRRRSSIGLTKIQNNLTDASMDPLRNLGENLYDSFDKSIDAIDFAVQEICYPSNSDKLSIEEDLETLNLDKNEISSENLFFQTIFQR